MRLWWAAEARSQRSNGKSQIQGLKALPCAQCIVLMKYAGYGPSVSS